MIVNSRVRRLIEFSVAGMMLLGLATALALRPEAPRVSVEARGIIDQPVVLNIKTLVYHCRACDLVKNCDADCVTVDIAEAIRRGGKPCLICGGNCLAKE